MIFAAFNYFGTLINYTLFVPLLKCLNQMSRPMTRRMRQAVMTMAMLRRVWRLEMRWRRVGVGRGWRVSGVCGGREVVVFVGGVGVTVAFFGMEMGVVTVVLGRILEVIVGSIGRVAAITSVRLTGITIAGFSISITVSSSGTISLLSISSISGSLDCGICNTSTAATLYSTLSTTIFLLQIN